MFVFPPSTALCVTLEEYTPEPGRKQARRGDSGTEAAAATKTAVPVVPEDSTGETPVFPFEVAFDRVRLALRASLECERPAFGVLGAIEDFAVGRYPDETFTG